MVDAQGTGNFIACARIDNLESYGLKAGWVKDAYLGITGEYKIDMSYFKCKEASMHFLEVVGR